MPVYGIGVYPVWPGYDWASCVRHIYLDMPGQIAQRHRPVQPRDDLDIIHELVDDLGRRLNGRFGQSCIDHGCRQ